MSTARTCSATPCRNTTQDASGLCHHHRGAPAFAGSVHTLEELRARSMRKIDPPSITSLPDPIEVTVELSTYTGERAEKFTQARHHRRDEVTHRDDGPAIVVTNSAGAVTEEIYVRHGNVHRLDGPAEIMYGPDGAVSGAVFLYQGDELSSLAEVTAQFAKRYRFLRSLGAYVDDPNVTESRGEIAASSYRVFVEEGRSIEEIVEVFEAGVHTHEGMRQVFDGAPAEWVAAYEDGAPA